MHLSAFKGALYGFCRPTNGEWELDVCSCFIVGAVRANDVKCAVIKRATQIVDRIPDDQSEISYRGFVSFCPDGTFAALIICFEGIEERLAFIEERTGFSDVLLGPL